eukprot:scaffold562_cov20-Tisochrysis_lutea.AAC.1
MADMSLRGATCISRAHLDSIRSKVLEPHDDYNTERLRLKALSDERASKWPNTLQAGRARKERARLERAAAEENERIEVSTWCARARAHTHTHTHTYTHTCQQHQKYGVSLLNSVSCSNSWALIGAEVSREHGLLKAWLHARMCFCFSSSHTKSL